MATRYENYMSGSFGTAFTVWGSRWRAQTFTPVIGHKITSVKLALGRKGSPGIMTVSIRAVDANNRPTGPDLASGTINANTFLITPPASVRYEEITFDAGIDLSAGTMYAIVVRCLTGDADINYARWEVDNGGTPYTGGEVELSSDSGATWTEYGAGDFDFFFQDWGDPILPTVTTQPVRGIEENTAIGNGNIIDSGGNNSITQHGVCWNVTGTPTIADSKTQDGIVGAGPFSSQMTELLENTLYSVRAYATTAAGTGYGEEVSFTTGGPPLYWYHLNVKGVNLPYVDLDGTKKLHIVLKNLSPTMKLSGEYGKVKVKVDYEPAA